MSTRAEALAHLSSKCGFAAVLDPLGGLRAAAPSPPARTWTARRPRASGSGRTTHVVGLGALRTAMGDMAGDFRAGQWEAVDAIVNRRAKVLCVQRTGWGKQGGLAFAFDLKAGERLIDYFAAGSENDE